MRIEIINPQLLARLLMVFGLLVFTNALAGTKDFALHQAVLDDDKQLVTRLLNKGAAINVIGSRKYGYGSALHLAVREGHLEIANLLLKRGAEVDVLDPDDFTPLHNAAWNGNLEMTELLLDAGADIEASTYDGDTPLSLAQNNNQPKVAEFIQAKLLASPVVDTKVASTPVSDPDAINISGTYISEITYPTHGEFYGDAQSVRFVKKKNRKEITLEQTGNAISGFDSTKDPKIIGTRDGNTINFYVLLPDQINGTWEINADGTEMVGKWDVGGRGLYGTWKLTKVVATKVKSTTGSEAGVIDVSGTYMSETTTHGSAVPIKLFMKKKNGKEITLEQTGNAIRVVDSSTKRETIGTREGNTINFYIFHSDVVNGTWEINADATEIVGKWSTEGHGGASGIWNLTRIESTADSDSEVRDVSGTYVMTNITGNWVLGTFVTKPRSKDVHEITIAQNGDQLTGTYDEGRGKLWGEIKGDTIRFDWVRGTNAGKGKWTFKPGSNESSVSLNAHSGSGIGLITEAKFNLTKTDTE